MKVSKLYDFSINSALCNVCQSVNNIVDFILDRYGPVRDDILFEIKVILNELLLNAIIHGNKEDKTKRVKVRTGIDNDFVYFIIEDEGEGFNFNCSSQPEECLDISDLKESGRGILIVKNLCDKVKYNTKGNKIVVLKKLN